mgnify:CR=1 FL=1
MKKVAITGGIGSGKTYISKMFSKLGVPIYNSDQKANSIIKSNIVVKKSIINAFGSDSFINNELNELDDLDLDSSEDYEQANNLFAKLK